MSLRSSIQGATDIITSEYGKTEEGYRGGQSGSTVSIQSEGNTYAILEDEDMANQCLECQPEEPESNVQDRQHSRTDSASADEFMNELHEAVALAEISSPQVRAQLPFRCAMDIPEVKLEGFVFTGNNLSPTCHRLESEIIAKETMDIEAEEEYDVAWTGM